jgi:opacity protein-like surface antigen
MFNKNFLAGVVLASASLSAQAEHTFSTELLLGQAKLDDEVISIDDTSIGFRFSYSPLDFLAIEASYQDYGKPSITNYQTFFGALLDEEYEFRTTALNVGVKGIFPVNDNIDINFRLGFSNWDLENIYSGTVTYFSIYTENEITEPANGSDKFDGTDLYYGIGAQYDVTSELFVGLEHTISKLDVEVDSSTSGDLDIKNTTLSVGYKF